MIPLLRTLEAWTVHQDYFWFLGLLAWAAVAFGVTRREVTGGKPRHWLGLLAAMFALICALEIVMFATAANFTPPYLWWDFSLGLALSAAVGAMLQPAVERLKSATRTAISVTLAVALTALAIGRWWSPIAAGFALSLAGAIAALLLVRANDRGDLWPDATDVERKRFRRVFALLAIIPVLIDFGPLAYAAGDGRRSTDLSHFVLVAAVLCLAAGTLTVQMIWRRYARSTVWWEQMRRELRVPFAMLGVWLAIGFLLTLGSGWLARRSYEKNLVLRAQISAALLDSDALKEVLGPKLKPGPIQTRRMTATNAVVFTTSLGGFGSRPEFEKLRAQLRQIRALNPDFGHVIITTLRNGHLLSVATHADRPTSARTQFVFRPATPADERDLQAKRVMIEGPARTPLGSVLTLRVPLQPVNSAPLGWLMVDVSAANWTTTFASARFQTLFIVAIGVALWATAIAYRLRRVEREQAERIAREAAAADRTKSEFLAHVSHELRTPIQSVLGYAELLASAPLETIERQRLAALRSQGDLLLRLVNDLIDLGALQAGVFRLQPTRVDAAALTRECLEAIRPAAEAKRLALHLELAPDLTWIEADGQRLRQILLNLLNNAVKFTATGAVTLRLARATDTDGALEWTVQDTGPGIAPEDQERVFQPFVRLERDDAIAGAGMGLSLCARLCAAMNGAIRVHSDGETGTTFIVRLPLQARETVALPARPASPRDAPAPAWRELRVLVADDNTLVRELLVAFFQQHGATTTAVGDGLAAVEACAAREFDLVVLDLSMPWLDGREAARRLREPGGALGAPWIIGLSAHAGRDEAESALAAGMNRFLTKPVALSALAAAVAEMPRLHAQPRPSSLRSEPDPALERRLATQFAAETPAIVTELHAACASGDRSRLRSRAHYLKNSADVLGAEALRRACSALYAQAESAGMDALRELVAAVEAESRPRCARREFRPDFPAQP